MPKEEYLDISLRKIAKGAGIGFIGTFIGMAFGYLSRMIIARFLGASDYGLISLGFAVMSIGATLSLVGLQAGIQRYVSLYKGVGDKRRIKGTILGAIKISFPLSLLITFILFLGADWISIYFFHSPELAQVLRIFVVAIPFWVLKVNFNAATVGFQVMQYQVYVNQFFENIFKLGAIVLLLALGFGVLGAAWGWAFAIILTTFLAFYFLEEKVFPFFHTEVKAILVEKELFSFSFPLIFAGMSGLITSWTDTFMLGYFSTTSNVGIYNAALPTAKLLSVGTGAFAVIFMPVVSELYINNRWGDLRDVYCSVTKWILSITLPLFLLLSLFSASVMRIMFGSEYTAGATALSILAFSYFITSLFGLAAPLLQTYGRTKVIMVSSFFGAGANIGLNLLLVPTYGIDGAAIATGISVILMNFLLLLFAYRIGKLLPFKGSFFKPIIASIAALSIVFVLAEYMLAISLFSLIGLLVVYFAIYFFLLLLFRSFEEEDLIIMRAMDQRLGTKSSWVRKIIQRFF